MAEVTLITGASSGIGRALALEFARHGYNLVLVAHRADKLQEVREAIREENDGLLVDCVPIDLMERDAPERLLVLCRQHDYEVSILVNDAGMGAEGDFCELGADRQQRIIDLNVSALTAMCHAFLPGMRERGRGTVANVASTTAFMPLASEAVYAATKAYVLSFSQALYEENRRYGVTVCTLCPGVTATDFFATAGFELGRFKPASPEDFARFAYRAIQAGRPLAIHGASNRLIALWARLFPRGAVRSISAAACK